MKIKIRAKFQLMQKKFNSTHKIFSEYLDLTFCPVLIWLDKAKLVLYKVYFS